MHDPKSEKEFNLEKIRRNYGSKLFWNNEFINSVYEYFKEKKVAKYLLFLQWLVIRGLPAAGAYCASKSALTSFAESLYFDMKRKM